MFTQLGKEKGKRVFHQNACQSMSTYVFRPPHLSLRMSRYVALGFFLPPSRGFFFVTMATGGNEATSTDRTPPPSHSPPARRFD